MTELQNEINNLLDEGKSRVRNAIVDQSIDELADAVDCVLEILDRLHRTPEEK